MSCHSSARCVGHCRLGGLHARHVHTGAFALVCVVFRATPHLPNLMLLLVMTSGAKMIKDPLLVCYYAALCRSHTDWQGGGAENAVAASRLVVYRNCCICCGVPGPAMRGAVSTPSHCHYCITLPPAVPPCMLPTWPRSRVPQAGTYVKEFCHGDFGRCRPSVGDLLARIRAEAGPAAGTGTNASAERAEAVEAGAAATATGSNAEAGVAGGKGGAVPTAADAEHKVAEAAGGAGTGATAGAAGGTGAGSGSGACGGPSAIHVEILQLDVLDVHLENWP